jgi:hypothetical protein
VLMNQPEMMNGDNEDNERGSQGIIDISDEMIADINCITKTCGLLVPEAS